MKMERAQRIIDENIGYRVLFTKKVSENKYLSDFFPEMDELPIPDETEAWELAKKFYVSTEKTYTVEVVTGALHHLLNSNSRILEGYNRS